MMPRTFRENALIEEDFFWSDVMQVFTHFWCSASAEPGVCSYGRVA